MKLLCLLAISAFLSSCAPQKATPEHFFGDHPPRAVPQETEILVSLHPAHIDDYDRICDQLGQLAWDDGIRQLLRAYVDQAPVLRPVEPPDESPSFPAGATQIHVPECDPWLDSITGAVSQRVRYSSVLMPIKPFGGMIDALQDNKTMGGLLSRAYVSLFGQPLKEEPVPVLIVQQSPGLETGLVQVVGSGLITQLTDTMGQMLIQESTREILPGDLFFQLQVRAETLPMTGDLVPLGPGERD
ncbi:hypothetical protein SAMN05660653_01722 [Desulfonatronum thiosulfatophilum]|uniref:Lipoprotein n=1 Tax=Desulfonatronum thiosulfatophilum TaxID=617002 RepID=A0A1G6CUE5_9BACT|nr:hypothetical protein [Desulfonatronum thiosulfatophilum]SDB36452.1 hypothetical protein SAMN05660653_01722 [Desulfonatronum thiosulfatophilum]